MKFLLSFLLFTVLYQLSFSLPVNDDFVGGVEQISIEEAEELWNNYNDLLDEKLTLLKLESATSQVVAGRLVRLKGYFIDDKNDEYLCEVELLIAPWDENKMSIVKREMILENQGEVGGSTQIRLLEGEQLWNDYKDLLDETLVLVKLQSATSQVVAGRLVRLSGIFMDNKNNMIQCEIELLIAPWLGNQMKVLNRKFIN